MVAFRRSGGTIRTPVVLILFNRPDALRRVFERVAEARPETLFLIADGPREGNSGDHELCAKARDIVSDISWPTEVHVNFSEINVGCGRRIASGLDWVFSRVSEAIILEDDCLPSSQFFPFCEEMLGRYRNDNRIGVISGDNFVTPELRCSESYYFSRYAHVWGWATWRRTWRLFDFQLSKWPRFRSPDLLSKITQRPETVRFWTEVFDHQYISHSAWANRLVFTCFVNGLLNIIPEQNLVSNIGWGEAATHAMDSESPLANLPTGHIEFPLRHPDFFIPFREADELTELVQFNRD
jgi:hypothetical protein